MKKETVVQVQSELDVVESERRKTKRSLEELKNRKEELRSYL